VITDFLEKCAARLRKTPRRVKVLVGLVAVLLIITIGLPATLMSQPAVIGRVAELTDNSASLQASMHTGMTCGQCHVDSRGRLLGTFARVADFYRTVLSPETELAYIEFETPRADACIVCHEETWSADAERTTRIPHPAHLRLSEETRECVECHKWTAHQEPYMEEHKTMEFSGLCSAYGCHSGWKRMDECASCHHSLLEEPEEWATLHPSVVFTSGDGGCLELCHDVSQCRQCHTTGESPFEGVPDQTERDALEAEHAQADWTRTHGPRALRDQSACLTCHISLGPCQNCHAQRPASHGPEGMWIGAHQDAVKVEGQCMTCHEQTYCDHCHDQFKEMR